jgi:iron complex transport system permease protein
VGGALAVSGASYQTLFKNPLVSPSILGVSSGAAFGAALAMVMNGPWWAVQICALVFGLLAVLGASLISLIFGRRELTVLILGGVVVSSLFGSMLSIIKLVADTDSQLPSIVFWMMGSLGRGTNEDVLVMLGCLAASLLMLYLFRYQINALSAGQDEAASMGVRTGLVKAVVIVSATLMTVSAVSICGIVGWVGMVIPHIARTITGASFPKLTVISFGLGALFLLLVDTLIRGVPGLDLPLGVLTSIIGTPIFVFFLSRVRKGW